MSYNQGNEEKNALGIITSSQSTKIDTYNENGICIKVDNMWQKWIEQARKSALDISSFRCYGDIANIIKHNGGALVASSHQVITRNPDLVTATVQTSKNPGNSTPLKENKVQNYWLNLKHPERLAPQIPVITDEYTTPAVTRQQEYASSLSPEFKHQLEQDGLINTMER